MTTQATEILNDVGDVVGILRIKNEEGTISVAFHPMNVNGKEHKPLGYVLGYNYLSYTLKK